MCFLVIGCIFGKQNIARGGEELKIYAEYVRSVYETKIRGKQSAGADTTEEETIVSKIDELLK